MAYSLGTPPPTRSIAAGRSPARVSVPGSPQRKSCMKSINRSVISVVVCLAFSALFAGAAIAQNDSQVGVWKLNVAKSKYSPGPIPTNGTTTIEAAAGGTKVSVDQTFPDGSK